MKFNKPEIYQCYRLIIDRDLYEYIMTLAQESAPNEILGMGAISKKYSANRTDFILEEVYIPEQFVLPGYCKFKEGAQNEIIEEVIASGGDPEKLCFRWHSHGNGSVYFSPVDESDIGNCDSPYVVNLVVNAEREMIARLDVFEPVHFHNIPVSIIIEPVKDKELVAECRADIEACCEPMPPKTVYRDIKLTGECGPTTSFD